MGLFSKLFGAKKTSAPTKACPQNVSRNEEEYFDSLLTEENFPGYTLEKNVHVSRFDANAHPSCLPVNYLFMKDNTPVLAVMLMQRNHYRAMIALGTYQVLDGKQIPYMRFFKGFRNEKTYVLDRVRAGLEGQL